MAESMIFLSGIGSLLCFASLLEINVGFNPTRQDPLLALYFLPRWFNHLASKVFIDKIFQIPYPNQQPVQFAARSNTRQQTCFDPLMNQIDLGT